MAGAMVSQEVRSSFFHPMAYPQPLGADQKLAPSLSGRGASSALSDRSIDVAIDAETPIG